MTTVWWVRDDLRIADNPALLEAASRGDVVALHVDERIDGVRPLGGASRWWLHHSLQALAAALRERGVPLVLASGDPREVLADAASVAGVDAVVWNRRYHAPARDVDAEIKGDLQERGLEATSFQANLLHEPHTIEKKDGGSYRVYTPFARACLDRPPPRQPHPEPGDLRGPSTLTTVVAGHRLETWLDPHRFSEALAARGWVPTTPDWAGGLRERWTPGEAGGRERLAALESVVPGYGESRDRPAVAGTSYLSPHLRFGEVSPFQAWHQAEAAPEDADDLATFQGELLWREFAWHRRYHLPDLATENIRTEFDAFPWDDDAQSLEAWQMGRTGVPLVDAGMRELWETGYMHNRVRMVAASFLVKNLRQHWRRGEEWFWDTLVDADEAANPFNWQWVAGTGDDAAPYFRIFNPYRQAERFDPDGAYVTAWLGDSTEEPIVDVGETRAIALDAYQNLDR